MSASASSRGDEGKCTGLSLIARHGWVWGCLTGRPTSHLSASGRVKAAHPVRREPTRVGPPGAFVRGTRIRVGVGIKTIKIILIKLILLLRLPGSGMLGEAKQVNVLKIILISINNTDM